ncbi:aa3-type cytochrome c oxidase subunit IV [Tranquillimonas alkanivorans]|uniref:Aa3 type cytochrome c oxidase subunit IV n=1 Tax=Tranquillimonas alkanivorans TaxID=441119 RepID=A0A1I5KX52_9RHOB|nr:aa3-type cytochrome c oxidase subunit IV [Tranquillimonas alkanivorans]SFO89482.1 aa3 type cytochrome c oxidase subunit IV [Tranquillimonas alkanivorans]
MAEDKHTHGKMDIVEQEKTFASFMSLTVKTVVAIIVILILLALVNG